ncbi:MAG: ORF6N domain-containing protein [Opitutae bacterium]|nr:ORF6N domain-containing protein [Opitutae bacterium]
MCARLRSTLPRQARPPSSALTSVESVIHTIRGERVVLDADLAKLYGVETKALNQAVRRNREKFPPDFMLELTLAEAEQLRRSRSQFVTASSGRSLRSQIVTSNVGRGGRRYLPFAFTEHGAIMAANILNSPQAVSMSVFVVRAFVKMRSLLTDTRGLAKKLASLEKELTSRLDSHETAIFDVLQRIMLLLEPPAASGVPDKEMGFHTTLKPGRK